MWDNTNYNAGFFVIQPTTDGIKLWQRTCQITSVDSGINDQIALNRAIGELTKSSAIFSFLFIQCSQAIIKIDELFLIATGSMAYE